MGTKTILPKQPQSRNNSSPRLTDRWALILARAALGYIACGQPWAVTFDENDLSLAIERVGEIIKRMEVDNDER